jgi:predicted ABC-type ATPase
MGKQEKEISEKAAQYVRDHADEIAEKYAGDNFKPDDVPVSVFMAGSPGAGKTEFSKAFIDILEKPDGVANQRVIRIDADRIREDLPGYTGDNSRLFQHATSIAVDKIHDHALYNDKNFVLDTTFTGNSYQENIERSLDPKRDRNVIIIYVYQDPHEAWKVTQQREKVEGRNILKEEFTDQFFQAKENVNEIKGEFGDEVTVHLLKRNIKSDNSDLEINIKKIDNYIDIDYTREQLKEKLQNHV